MTNSTTSETPTTSVTTSYPPSSSETTTTDESSLQFSLILIISIFLVIPVARKEEILNFHFVKILI